MLLGEALKLEPGRPHWHAERFRFVASGYGAAIVVAQHDDRLVVEFGIEDALTGDVEVVYVDQGDGSRHGLPELAE